jgi:hypothetical protein
MTPADVLALARTTSTTDIPTAAAAIGFGAALGYDLASRDEFPVRVLRLGRKLLVPTADLVAYLGISPVPASEAKAAAQESTRLTDWETQS